jgi:hypothetical protein
MKLGKCICKLMLKQSDVMGKVAQGANSPRGVSA